MKIRTAVPIAGLAMQLAAYPIAYASPMQLDATALVGSVGSFVFDFDDTVGDGLLRLGVITAFSGVSAGTGSTWGFGTAQSGGNRQAATDASLWRYAVQPAAVAVPEPGSVALALAALGVATRRRGSGAAPGCGDCSPARSAGRRRSCAACPAPVVAGGLQVLRDGPELAHGLVGPLGAGAYGVIETVVDVVVYQGLLGARDRLLHGLQLLGHVQAVPVRLEHRDDAAQVAFGAFQALDDLRVRSAGGGREGRHILWGRIG